MPLECNLLLLKMCKYITMINCALIYIFKIKNFSHISNISSNFLCLYQPKIILTKSLHWEPKLTQKKDVLLNLFASSQCIRTHLLQKFDYIQLLYVWTIFPLDGKASISSKVIMTTTFSNQTINLWFFSCDFTNNRSNPILSWWALLPILLHNKWLQKLLFLCIYMFIKLFY